MSAHTPGPWKAVASAAEGDDWEIETIAEGYHLGRICGLANARLIAAAPEMLEALREWEDVRFYIIDALKRLPDTDALRSTIHDNLDRAKAAIAKAEGREP